MLVKLHFALLLLLRYKKKHISIFSLLTLLIALITSVIFVSSSLQHDIYQTLDAQADITLQKYRAGRVEDAPASWVDEALEIDGVANAQGRIYGMHFYEPLEEHFMVVGVDFYDEQIEKSLQKVVENLDVEKFLERKNMLIGSDVKRFFDEYEYKEYYIFRPPDRSREKLYIYGELDEKSSVVSGNLILMSQENARTILGVQEGYVSDVVLKVPNKDELETIVNKLKIAHFDMRIITKEQIENYYKDLFNYKGGLFLSLYIIVILSFMLILYQRYSLTKSVELKEVALLRLSGWKVDEVIWLKLFENFVVIVSAFMSGVIFAFVYVYYIGGGFLKSIFLGSENLLSNATLSPVIDTQTLFGIFLFFTLPYLATIVIPLWRESVRDSMEILR